MRTAASARVRSGPTAAAVLYPRTNARRFILASRSGRQAPHFGPLILPKLHSLGALPPVNFAILVDNRHCIDRGGAAAAADNLKGTYSLVEGPKTTPRLSPMSQLGHLRRFGCAPAISGLPPDSRHVVERWGSNGQQINRRLGRAFKWSSLPQAGCSASGTVP
jgi:hypothetical protein